MGVIIISCLLRGNYSCCSLLFTDKLLKNYNIENVLVLQTFEKKKSHTKFLRKYRKE